ncbi:MAG: ATP-dependent zinc metalloprotease FtsH [Ruminococcaceae bacterium]|nr:ATP-dependent zinc metalloprotease FtsH [Oscillospiraceae bacterium]
MKKNVKVIIFYIVLIVGILIATSTLMGTKTNNKEIQYSEVVELFQNEQVKSYVVHEDNTIDITTQKDEKLTFKIRDLAIFENDLKELILEQKKEGIITEFHYEEPTEMPWWVSFVPYIIIAVIFIVIWIVIMNSAGGKGGKMNSFGRSKAKLGANEKNKVLFTDVAGADEEKEELQEVVEFLKNPQKFTKLGAKIPRGVLLVGPPGTGKTLLAKAVAGEANVPFFSISGSDFVEMYVGVGASRVRDLFDTAKKSQNAIIFIDEIDAVGRHRGAGLGGGHDEREQTLNQLLVEMDGFGNNDGIIVIAATNRPDILDPALLRPGRFDRQITVNYPDIKGREEILKVHSRNKPFEKDVDLKTLAKTTAGFTGADLANLLNEAALLAARKGKHLIGMTELEEATIKTIVGPKKKSKVISEREKKITAYHEAGHAVITQLLETQDTVHQISIIPAGRAGGYTLSLPTEDKMYMTKREMEEEIVSLLGGRVAEAIVFGDISTGASNDIERATKMARGMVTKYGMSDLLGPIVYGTGHEEVFLGRDFGSTRDFSEKVAADIDAEVRSIVDKAYKHATDILTKNRDKLNFTAEYLIDHEIMDEDQFKYIMETSEPTVEGVEAIAESKTKKSDAENLEQKELNAQKEQQEKEKQQQENQRWQQAARMTDPEFQRYTVKKKEEEDSQKPSDDENKTE